MKQKILKKLISAMLAIIIITNILPNFGLLINTVEASTSDSKVSLEINEEHGIVDDGDFKGFAMDIFVNNFNATSFVLPIKYDNTKIKPATAVFKRGVFQWFEEATDIDSFVSGQVDEEIIATASGTTSQMGDGYVDLEFFKESGENIVLTEKTLICTIYFTLEDTTITDLSQIDNNIISLDESKCEIFLVDVGDIKTAKDFSVGYIQKEEIKVTGITITTDPKKEYIVGDTLDLSDMVVTATYSDGSSKPTTDYTTNADTLDLAIAGTKTLTVTYSGTDIAEGATAPTANTDITVREEKITKIEFQGFNASYKQGDTIDLSTISVIATYEKAETGTKVLDSDKYTLSATGNSIVGNKITLTNAGDTIITATLKEDTSKTATKTITIAEKQLTGIEITAPTKDTYTVGETLDLTGLTVTAKYNNNGTEETETITSGYTTSISEGTALSTAGVQSISVDYNGQTATFDVVVFPTKLVGTQGENLSTVLVEGFTWDNGNATIVVGENEYTLKYTNTDPAKQKTCNVKVLGLPTNLTATYGDQLSTVVIPTGFAWANATELVGDVGDRQHNITYTGYTGLTATVTVAKKTLTKADLTYTMLSGKEYDGQPINDLSVTVPTGAGTVTVKYYKNGETIGSTVAPTNVGTYKVKVSVAEGTNYTELTETELDGSFEITRGKLVAGNFDTTIPEDKVYDGTAITAATATVKSGIVGAGTTVTVKYYKGGQTSGSTTAPSDYGTYTVKVNINEGTNYFAADGTDGKEEIQIGTFSITKKQLTKDDIDFTAPNPKVYDGSEKTATVAIKSSVVGAGTISAITYYKNGVATSPIDAGEYIVKITTTGATNYDNVTDLEVGRFTIEKADPIYTIPSGLTATYGDELSTVTLPAGFTWEESGKVGDAGTRTHTVKYAPITDAEKNNYKEKTGINVDIEVGKANLQAADFDLQGMPTNNTKEYDGNPVNVTSTVKTAIPGADDIRNAVTVEYYKDGAKVTDTSDFGTYEVKVSVAEGNNYNAVNGLKVGEFSVTKATLDIAEITVDDPENNVYDGTPKTPTVNIPTGAGTAKEIKYYKDGAEVTNPTDAGIYTVKITTENATNYADITTLTEVGTFTIEKADINPSKITVTPDAEKTYDGNPSTATAVLDTTVQGATDVTIDVTYVDEDGHTVTSPTDAGTYTIKVSSNGGANYNPLTVTAKTETIVINKVALSADDIQCTLPANLVYDNTSKKATITVSKDLGNGKTLTVDADDITITYKDAEGNIVSDPKNAGTYTIDVSVSAGKNYEALTAVGVETYTVEKATLVVGDFEITGMPAGGSKQHDGIAVSVTAAQKSHITETLNAEVQYYLSTDTEHALLSAPGGVGTYIVKLKVTEGTNYKAANLDLGTFTITPKGFDPSKIKYTNTAEYDGTNKDNSTVNIYIDGDTLATIADVKFYKDGAEVNAKNVGTYTVKADITTTESGHVGVIEVGTFTITAKPITVKIQDETMVYGEDLTTIRVNDDVAVCAGDNINDIITYELSAKTVGEQTIIGKVKDTKTAKNYNVTFTNGKCTITKKPITVQIGNTSSVYTGTEPTLPDTSTLVTIPDGAIVGTDDLGITLTKASGVDAGDYDITATYTNANYNITFENKEDNTKATGTYTITKATLTSEDFNKDLPAGDVTFGTAVTVNPTYKAGITTLDAGAITVKYYKKEDDTEVPNPTAVGTYVVKVSTPGGTNYYPADGSTDSEGNTYEEITLGEFSIVRSSELPTITVTAPADNTYDGTKKEPTVTIPAGTGNSTITYYKKEDGSEVTDPIDAGTYIVKVSTDGGENYGPMTETKVGEFTILPRPVTVTIDDKTSVYGNELAELTSNITVGDVITGDDLGITLTKATGTDVAEYDITGTASNTNYDVTFVDGTYEITAKPITVTIDNLTSVYGETLEELACTTTDTLAAGDTLEQIIELNTTATTTSNVGTYDITGTVINNNYTVTYTNANNKGTYTITKADPECNIAELPATYGDTLANVTLPTRADGTYTWNDATTTSVGNAGRHTFKVTFTPNDTTNYNTLTDIDVTVNVAKAIPPYTKPTGLEGYEGQPLSSIDITSNTGFSWTDATTTLPLIKDNGETFNTTMTYTPADTDNYETVENISVQVKVKENEIKAIRVSSTKADGTNPEYYEGQTFARADILVEAEWAIGGWQTVTDYTIVDETRSLTTSDTEMVINYAGKTANQAITVKADEVIDITITPPNKLKYDYGDEIDLTGATITKIWASGRTQASDTENMTIAMLENADVTDFTNMEVLGQKQITVKYGTVIKSNAFQIEVEDAIENITIVDKTILEKDYNYNQPIDVIGGQISINYKSGHTETENITTSMLSGYSMTTVKDNQIVTVTYTDDKGKKYTDTFKINVKDAVIGIDITKEPAKKLYKLNEAQSFADLEVVNVMASGNAGTKLAAGEYTISGFDSTSVGEKTITVTQNGTGFTDTFKVKVIDVTTDMFISNLPKQTYKYGEGLSLIGGKITVKTEGNTTGTEIEMTNSSVTVTGYNPNKLGDQTITVTYTYTEETETGIETKQKTDTYTVTVEDYETGIRVTPPTKTTYGYNEPLDLTGATVSKVWASGKTTDTTPIDGSMISSYSATNIGTQTIKVNAFGKDNVGSFEVSVVDKTIGISMKKQPNKQTYTQGDSIDVTGAVLNVTKQSGIKEIPITKEMISGYNPNKVGTQVITVTYDGKQTEFVINVKEAPKKPTTPTKPTKPSRPVRPITPITPEIAKYKVTFVNYDGTVLKIEEVESGKGATAPEVEKRDGYKFKGWDKLFDEVKEDITVKAQYQEIERAKVKGSVTVEKGEEPDLSDVTIEIFDEDGEKIDEIPVTLDMISGFNPEKIGTQVVNVAYVGEDGYEYTDTLKIRVVRPTETLGVKDEFVETKKEDMPFIPVVAGVSGAVGLLLILLALASKKNVEIYALTENGRKLVGKQKISKNNARIVLDEYEKKLQNANIEIVLSKKITKKLDDEVVSVVLNGKRSTYKVQYINNERFTIRMKNVD